MDEVHRATMRSLIAAHLEAVAAGVATLLSNPDQIDADVVVGHLQAWLDAIAKLK